MAHTHTQTSTFSDRLKNYIPKSITCLREYSLSNLRKDLIAGFTVGVIAFPFAIAAAVGANISPERGLFTAIVAGFLISALGGSRVQIGGPTSTFIVILYGILTRYGFDSLVIATLMAGVILILFGLAGFGTYFKYIPYPVVTGLTTGIAVIIFSGQIKDFLGLDTGPLPADFLKKWGAYYEHISSWNIWAVGVGVSTLFIIIFFRRYKPRLPGAIIALAIVSFITWIFQLDVDTIGSTYGSVHRTLPSPSLPSLSLENILNLVPDALTIALLVGIESLLSAVVSEGMTGWKHQSNCELVAQGLANIGSVIFGGLPASGSISRTAANVKSGATSPLAGMVHALTLFLILFFLTPLINSIPLASLAAVLIMIAWGMSELHHFLHLFTAPLRDIAVLVTVFTLTILLNITVALQIGMILAAFLFMKQMSDLSDVVSVTDILEEPVDPSLRDPDILQRSQIPERVEIYEINGPFFFGVADRLKNLLNGIERPPKVFILRMRKVPTIDASGMHALEEFALECQRQGTVLLLSGVKRNPLKDLERYQLDELIGKERIFPHIQPALAFTNALLAVPEDKGSATLV